MRKRLLAIILGVCFVLSVCALGLVGCSKDSDNSDGQENEQEQEQDGGGVV